MAGTKQADFFDTAYFAGFFDGEGCVAAYKRKYSVILSNTDPRPLLEAQVIWGGTIDCQKAVGRRYAVRDLWRWKIYGQKSRPFLEAIRPFVRLKGEQIDEYLTILSLLPVGRGRRQTITTAPLIAAGRARLHLMKRGA